MKLSHAASTTLTAIAELPAPIGVGSGDLLGHTALLKQMEVFGIIPRLVVPPIIRHTNGKFLPAPNNQPATIAKPHRGNRHQLSLAVQQAIARMCAPRQ